MFQGKGQYIYSSHTTYHEDNHCLWHILVDNLCKDRLDTQADRCIFHWNIVHLIHMEMGYMGHHAEVLLLQTENQKVLRAIKNRLEEILTWRRLRITVCERISSIMFWTWANWSVIDNSADCIEAARSKTWVSTFLIDTCFVTWAFRVDWTFRTAIWRRSNISRQTWTWRWSIDISTLWKWATWWWVARVTVRILSWW